MGKIVKTTTICVIPMIPLFCYFVKAVDDKIVHYIHT